MPENIGTVSSGALGKEPCVPQERIPSRIPITKMGIEVFRREIRMEKVNTVDRL